MARKNNLQLRKQKVEYQKQREELAQLKREARQQNKQKRKDEEMKDDLAVDNPEVDAELKAIKNPKMRRRMINEVRRLALKGIKVKPKALPVSMQLESEK